MTHPSDLAELRDELRLILERLKELGPEGISTIEAEVQAAKKEDLQVAS